MSDTSRNTKSPEAWAAQILLHAHAIAPCPEHGFMRLKFDHTSLDYAHALAAATPYPGKSKANSAAILDNISME
ncbi:MAG: hypothetical protein JWQ94_4919 [Tardiphaga sp.]|nr:hypothetical protein [Tardiphaga sp.]